MTKVDAMDAWSVDSMVVVKAETRVVGLVPSMVALWVVEMVDQ